MGLKVHSVYLWSKTPPICISKAFVLRVQSPFVSGCAWALVCIRAILFVSDTRNLEFLSEGNPACCSFCGRSFSRAVIMSKFGTNCWYMLHSFRKCGNCVTNVGRWSLRMVSVVFDANLKLFGWITSPRLSMVFAKELHFQSLRRAFVSLKSVST